MNNVDRVIIAGAGPVGCASALYLAQNDIPVTLIESCDSLPETFERQLFIRRRWKCWMTWGWSTK